MKTLKWYKVKILSEDSSDIIKTILENRHIDITYAWDYFEPKMSKLHDPFLFAWMEKAIERILETINSQERVVVFGDYDVDGVSSTALLSKFLASIWINISYRLPHRVDDWYGLKKYFIDELAEKEVKLIITVDCWSRDTDVIEYAKSKWIDIIITDHHFTSDPISDQVIAYINPNSPWCEYPFKELSGSWVAFKLLCWIASKLYDKRKYEKVILEYVDMASLWTVADCMPLVDENRIITFFGLQWLRTSTSAWLRCLIENIDDKDLDWDTIWFRIWPIINAAGRMDTPYRALKFLLAKEELVKEQLWEIEELNKQRRKLTADFFKKALEYVDENEHILFYNSEEIEHGIIWLVSWNVCQKFNKPCIVLKDLGDILVASCRSPEYFNVVQFLGQFEEYFLHFWWHSQAAWFTISKEKYEGFRELVNGKAKEIIENIDKTKILEVDSILEVSQINFGLLNKILKMKPFWIGNPKPVFIIKDFLFSAVNLIWADKKHLKFVYNDSSISFVAFGFWEYYDQIKNASKVDLIGEIERNVWNGKEFLNFYVKDMVI